MQIAGCCTVMGLTLRARRSQRLGSFCQRQVRSTRTQRHNSLPDTPDESEVAEAIIALQARLVEEHPFRNNTGALRRFLIARKLDVDAALSMLNAHVEWRAKNLPVVLTPEIQAELRKGKFYVLPGAEDVNGYPVVVVRSGLFDPQERDLDTCIKAFIYLLEQSLATLDESGKFSIMYDRDGFSVRKNFDFDLLKAWAGIASDNYPERLASVALYPSGVVLAGLWKVVSVFFDSRTRAKIKMVQNEDELATLIPKNALPPRYGGTSDYEFDPEFVYGDDVMAA